MWHRNFVIESTKEVRNLRVNDDNKSSKTKSKVLELLPYIYVKHSFV